MAITSFTDYVYFIFKYLSKAVTLCHMYKLIQLYIVGKRGNVEIKATHHLGIEPGTSRLKSRIL